MTISKAFGSLKPFIPHLAQADPELEDLRRDVESAFVDAEAALYAPQIYGVRSDRVNGGAHVPAGMPGIADDQDTLLTLLGDNLEGTKGRDKFTYLDVAGAASSFEVYALDLGNTGLHIDVVDNGVNPDDVSYSATTNTITFSLTAAHPTPANMVTILGTHAAINAMIAVIPRGGGGGNITLPVSFDLIGGGVSYHQVVGGDGNGMLYIYAKEPGNLGLYWQILSDTTDALRSVEIVNHQILVHLESTVTTALKVKNLIEASAVVSALVGVYLPGTGATAVAAGDVNATPVVFTLVGDDPAEEAVAIYAGGVELDHLGTNYTSLPPSGVLMIVKHSSGLLAGYALQDCVAVTGLIDGRFVRGPDTSVISAG